MTVSRSVDACGQVGHGGAGGKHYKGQERTLRETDMFRTLTVVVVS